MNTYKFILAFFIVLFILVIGCDSKQDNKTITVNNINSNNQNKTTVDIIDTTFKRLINKYIKDYDGRFIEKDYLYYNLFIYKNESDYYVTIWISTCFPNVFLKKDKYFNYYLYNINNRKVVFISENEYELKKILNVTTEDKERAYREMKKEYIGPVYDGDMFFETYKLNLNNYQVVAYTKVEKANIFFLNIKPPDSFIH